MLHPASTSAFPSCNCRANECPAIAPLPSRFKIGTNNKKYLDAHDGKVFCHLPPRVTTSPNAPTILRPFVYENKPVQCHADGRYGYVDIYQWPQMFCEEYPWGVAYPMKGMYWETDPLAHLWWMPMYADFVPLADTTLVIGFLSQEKCNELNKVQDIVKNCYALYKKSKVPKRNPCDQAVAEFQRSAMGCFAYFDYHQMILPSVQTPVFPYPEYNPYWLGAFTCDPGILETLFWAGIPVWLIRHKDTVTTNTSLLAKVVPREPDVVLAMFTDPIKHFARPFPVCYMGPSNYQHSLACRRFLRQDQMETWQVTPTNAAGTSTAGPLMAEGQSNSAISPLSNLLTEPQLRDRWIEVDHSLLPPKQNGWAAVLQKASRDETHVTHWLPAGYRYPELTVFANVGAPASRKRYLANWLALRPTCQLGDTTTTTRAGVKKAEAQAFFADALGDVPDGASMWAGDTTIVSLADPPLPLVHAILWELAELLFRSDLLTLNKALVPQLWDAPIREAQYLAIFSSEVIGGTWDTPLPQQHQGLFWGTLSNPRALDFADAFQLLLSAWPSVPRGIEEPLLVTMP
ncbi:hypothetical protein PAXINDRAFT_14435 [Paxillus involutus ATCC 200175]|uniref:Uncharacterized protein n=1 Tax=Paxillus involutus ATCC 200175 TaxID=664439 RepID=A0A0C9TQF0_PAXIN|nr:hypothetical protein PAXINDRAFT_14435 [Paxillus involutus ATCC 200175]